MQLNSNGIVNIKKSNYSELPFNGYDDTHVEKKGSIEVVGTHHLSDIFELYKKGLNKNYSHGKTFISLNSEEIELDQKHFPLFFDYLKQFGSHDNFDYYTGGFITQLISNNYKKDPLTPVFLNLKDIPVFDFLLSNFQGSEKTPLQIYVVGNTGDYFAQSSKNVMAVVKGVIGQYSFQTSTNPVVYASGEIRRCSFSYSTNLYLVAQGKIREDFAALARGLECLILGDSGISNCGYVKKDQVGILIKGNFRNELQIVNELEYKIKIDTFNQKMELIEQNGL